MNQWKIEEKFVKENIELNGRRYLIGNGYMGFSDTFSFKARNAVVTISARCS